MFVKLCGVIGGLLGIIFVIGTEKKWKNAEIIGVIAFIILLTGAFFA